MNRLSFLSLLLAAASAFGQGFTEPTLTLYGRVRQSGGGAEHVLTSGQMSITLVNTANPANVVTRTVTLQPVGTGPVKLFSYALEVPLKYNAAAYELTDVIEVKGNGTQMRVQSIVVNGSPAQLASSEDETLSFAQLNRADERRVDIVAGGAALDSDEDGIPDWWEEANGLNPFFAGDAGEDDDGDGLTNLAEFQLGTNPNDIGDGNRIPVLLTQQVLVTRDGVAGLALRVVDSDTAADAVTLTVGTIPAGLELQRDGTPLAAGATFTQAEVEAGQLTLRDTGSAVDGTLPLTLSDGTHPAVSASVAVSVFVPSTPALKANLWLDARSLPLASGQAVTAWTDRAGNVETNSQARALVQTSAANQPRFSLMNGRASVGFDGTASYLLVSDPALPTTTQALFVQYSPTPNSRSAQTLFQSNSLALQIAPFDGPVGYPGAASLTVGGQTIRGFRTQLGASVLAAFRLTDEQGFALSDGLFNGSPEVSSTALATVFPALGASVRYDATAPGQRRLETPFGGQVNEVLLYSRLLGDEFAQRVEMYLLSRWQDATIWSYAEELVGLTLRGGAGRDVLQGGYSADVIEGGAGDDLLYGGGGPDRLEGGPGADIFAYRTADKGDDTIADFTATGADHDTLDLSGLFLGQTGGAAAFISLQPDVRIENNVAVATTKVKLDYLGDGGAPDQILTLEGIALSNADLGWLLGERILLMGELRLDETIALSTVAVSIREGGSGSAMKLEVTVTRSGNTAHAQEVPVTFGGTATYLLDFTLDGATGTTRRPTVTFARGATTAKFFIVPVVDPRQEESETIIVQVVPRERDYQIAASQPAISLEEPVSISVAAAGNILARQSGQTGTFTITRSGSTASALSVLLSRSGSAVSGADYAALPTSVTIPSGLQSVIVPVLPVNSSSASIARLDLQVAQKPGEYVTIAPWTASFLFVPGNSIDEVGFGNWRDMRDPDNAAIPIADYATLDSDFDGDSNLTEYLNGTDPTDANDTGNFALTFALDPTARRFQLTQGSQRIDIFVDVEKSLDLAAWTPITADLTLVSSSMTPGTGYVRNYQQAHTPATLGDREFFRAAARFRDLSLLLGGEAVLLASGDAVFPLVTDGARSWKSDVEAGEGFLINGLAAGQSSSIAVSVTGPAVVSFDWRVTGDSADRQRLLLDSIETQALTAPSAWTPAQITLPAGEHLLRWQYTEGGSSGNGSASVRRVQIDPL